MKIGKDRFLVDLSSRSERLMGTTITVSICHPQANELLARCFELLRSYEHRFSANDASSELMEVNHQAGIAPVQVHPDLFELIALAGTISTPLIGGMIGVDPVAKINLS